MSVWVWVGGRVCMDVCVWMSVWVWVGGCVCMDVCVWMSVWVCVWVCVYGCVCGCVCCVCACGRVCGRVWAGLSGPGPWPRLAPRRAPQFARYFTPSQSDPSLREPRRTLTLTPSGVGVLITSSRRPPVLTTPPLRAAPAPAPASTPQICRGKISERQVHHIKCPALTPCAFPHPHCHLPCPCPCPSPWPLSHCPCPSFGLTHTAPCPLPLFWPLSHCPSPSPWPLSHCPAPWPLSPCPRPPVRCTTWWPGPTACGAWSASKSPTTTISSRWAGRPRPLGICPRPYLIPYSSLFMLLFIPLSRWAGRPRPLGICI